jgi:hypothetical protein
VQIDMAPLPQLILKKSGMASEEDWMLVGRAGTTYELQASPDLTAWTTFDTLNLTGSSAPVRDPLAKTTEHRFYRALSH